MPDRASAPTLRAGTLAALFYIGFASAGLLVFKPLIVGALIEDYAFSARQAGLIAGGEMAGIGVAALLSVLFGARSSRRLIVALGLVLGIVGCAAAAFTQEFGLLFALRVLAGVGSGLIASVVLATLGTTRNPDRTFGLYFIANYLAAACLFPVIAAYLRGYGVPGGYLFLGALLLGCYVVLRNVPAGSNVTSARTDLRPFPLLAAATSLAVSLAYWIGNGAVWAFIERLGLGSNLDASEVGTILSIGQLAAMAGALSASLVHTRFGRTLPILATIAISIVAMLLIGATAIAYAFSAGALLFCFSWSSFLAYLNGLMSSQDSAGRVVALSISSQTIGMTLGPIAAGALADAHGYHAIVGLGVGCHVVALLLLIPLVGRRRGRKDPAIPITV